MTRKNGKWKVADDLGKDRLRLRVTCCSKPVSGAYVGIYAHWCDAEPVPKGRKRGLTVHARNRKRQIKTNQDGVATINRKNLFWADCPEDHVEGLVVIHPDRQIGALLKVRPEQLGSEIKLALSPLCRVQGTLES